LEKLFSFLNLHPTRIEFDSPDVFVAVSRRAIDENIKTAKFSNSSFIIKSYFLHDWNNNNDYIETIFSFTAPGGHEKVGHMNYSNGI
jgi:hypothetical protein